MYLLSCEISNNNLVFFFLSEYLEKKRFYEHADILEGEGKYLYM